MVNKSSRLLFSIFKIFKKKKMKQSKLLLQNNENQPTFTPSWEPCPKTWNTTYLLFHRIRTKSSPLCHHCTSHHPILCLHESTHCCAGKAKRVFVGARGATSRLSFGFGECYYLFKWMLCYDKTWNFISLISLNLEVYFMQIFCLFQF